MKEYDAIPGKRAGPDPTSPELEEPLHRPEDIDEDFRRILEELRRSYETEAFP